LLVGGPSVSVAVKRAANTAADGVVKKPAVESVKRDSLQVFYLLYVQSFHGFFCTS